MKCRDHFKGESYANKGERKIAVGPKHWGHRCEEIQAGTRQVTLDNFLRLMGK